MTRIMRLRPATLDDLGLLRRWDAAPQIVATKGTEDWGWETERARNPDWREQLIAEVDDSSIGFVQIIDPARGQPLLGRLPGKPARHRHLDRRRNLYKGWTGYAGHENGNRTLLVRFGR